jgi:Asp-tRNA(Asn)/Glu-tRNA(Gln) amidotransferase A subunit family amidase
MIDPEIADPEVVRVFDQAVADLRAQGAEVIDPFAIPELDKSTPLSKLLKRENEIVWTRCSPFKFQLGDYLSNLGPGAPVHSLDEIAKSGKFHPLIQELIFRAGGVPRPPHEDPYCEPVREGTRQLRRLLTKVVAEHKLDAFVYPSWSIPPRLIGDLNSPDGLNSGRLASPTAYPSITVPMGYVHGTLPVGLEFLGLPWSDGTLIKLSYSYELATKRRHPPATVPPLAETAVQRERSPD